MPPVHPARTRRPSRPQWKVEVKSQGDYEHKSSGQYGPSKGTVIARGRTTEYVLTDADGNIYDASVTAEERVQYYTYPPRGYARPHLKERDRTKKPRISMSMSSDVEFLFVEPMKDVADFKDEYPTLESMHTSRGDYPLVDKEFDRYNGQHVAAEKMFVQWLLPLADPRFADAKYHFTNYAHCSCPCSPGFIASFPKSMQHPHLDFSISIRSRDETIIRKEEARVAAKKRAENELAKKEAELADAKAQVAELERSLARA